jgi:predicted alpha/beta hydrolase family esterase
VNGKEDQRILNNLPYAQRLSLQGWSKKVSADWFTRIAQNVENGKYLTQAYRQLGFK